MANDNVVVDKDRVESDFLGLFCRRDDRLGRGFEAEIVRIRCSGRKADRHGFSRVVGGNGDAILIEGNDGVRDVRVFQRAISSSDNFTSTAAIASSRWCNFVVPTIGAVITGFAKSQASAICARATPRASATSATR